ncbi:hypothetical protein LTR66_005113 [Elasticomyces elasticus]|nr:hypothetical protein LTR66_005113 [Elasticomyces elasticus]
MPYRDEHSSRLYARGTVDVMVLHFWTELVGLALWFLPSTALSGPLHGNTTTGSSNGSTTQWSLSTSYDTGFVPNRSQTVSLLGSTSRSWSASSSTTSGGSVALGEYIISGLGGFPKSTSDVSQMGSLRPSGATTLKTGSASQKPVYGMSNYSTDATGAIASPVFNHNTSTTVQQNSTLIASNYSINPTAVSCNAASLAWIDGYVSAIFMLYNTTTSLTLSTTIATKAPQSWSSTVMCDGYTHYLSPSPDAYVVTTYVTTYVTQAPKAFTQAQPNCTIEAQDCLALNAIYEASLSAYQDVWQTATGTITAAIPEPPQCSNSVAPDTYCGHCTIGAQMVELLYWPPIVEGDLCNRTTRTPTRTGIGPNTVVMSGVTYTSPTVYVAISMIQALWSANTDALASTCGPSILTTTFQMAPSEVSSVRRYNSAREPTVPTTAYPYDWADLDHPVSAPAYFGVGVDPYQGQAFTATYNRNGSFIYDYAYLPVLAVPSMLRSFYPAWSTCELDLYGIYDPPIALQPAQSMDTPIVSAMTFSSASSSVTTPATPPAAPQTIPSSTTTRPSVGKVTPLPSSTVIAYTVSTTVDTSSNNGPTSSGSKDNVPPSSASDPLPTQPIMATATSPRSAQGTQLQSSSPANIGGVLASLFGSANSLQPSQARPDSLVGGLSPESVIDSGSTGPSGTSVPVVAIGSTALLSAMTLTPSSQQPPTSRVVAAGAPTPAAIVTIGSNTYTAMGNSGTITFGSFTLTPGQAHTMSGITVSDASTGLVIDGSAVPLSTMYPLLSYQSPTPVHASGVYAVAGGQSFTVAPLGSSIIVNGGGTTTA